MYVCRVQKCVGGITWPKHAHAQSQFWQTRDTRIIPTISYSNFSMDKKESCSLINDKRKVNRASETEEQRKERLRIRREKDRARRRTKGKKRSSETDDHEKQRLATLKRLKRSDENELERKLRLEKMVATKWLRLAIPSRIGKRLSKKEKKNTRGKDKLFRNRRPRKTQ